MDRELEQRRRILFTMLTALDYSYPSGHEPALILGLRRWLHGWSGNGRIVAGMSRQGFDLQLTRHGDGGLGGRHSTRPAGRSPRRLPSGRRGTRTVDGGAA